MVHISEQLNGKDEFVRNCILTGQVDPLLFFKAAENMSADFAIHLALEDIANLVQACLKNKRPDDAIKALKNFSHTPESAQMVIFSFLQSARAATDDAARRMNWDRAYEFAITETPALCLEELLRFALDEGYYDRDKLDDIYGRIEREPTSAEMTILLTSLLSKNKHPEALKMAESGVLSEQDLESLINHCAQKGLYGDWWLALSIRGRPPTDANWTALWDGLKASAEENQQIVKCGAK